MEPSDDVFEHTLAVLREVFVYKLPPRLGSSGIKSGEWRVDDRIFTGRLILMDCGSTCELRLSDSNTGEIFAMCPVGIGERNVCVEAAADSSRNFVIRVVDPASKRHAFLGMGFAERGDAFDFNVALSDWEKHAQRAEQSASQPTSAGSASAAPKQDFSLKPGQTISVKKVAASCGGFLSGLGSSGGSGFGGGGDITAPSLQSPGLPPPPAAETFSGLGLLPPMQPVAGGGLGLPPPPAGTSGSTATQQVPRQAVAAAPPPAGEAANVGSGNHLDILGLKVSSEEPSKQKPASAATEVWTAFQ